MKKKLIWRLRESPTSKTLIELIESKLLTKEEAREILFSSKEESSDRNLKSYQSEIKFLRELVEKLSKGNYSSIITIIKEIPYKRFPWYGPYGFWMGGTTDRVYSSTTDNATGNIIGESNTTNAVDFTSIKTF